MRTPSKKRLATGVLRMKVSSSLMPGCVPPCPAGGRLLLLLLLLLLGLVPVIWLLVLVLLLLVEVELALLRSRSPPPLLVRRATHLTVLRLLQKRAATGELAAVSWAC
jgi:hypothetical protein